MGITAGEILDDDVGKGFEESINLLGKTVKYSRFKSMTGDPGGYTKKWWEENLEFEALVGPIDSYTLSQDDRLQQSDRKLIFKKSNFTSQATDDEAVPRSGDEVVIDSKTWTTELEEDAIWEEEATNNLFKVFIRRAT